MDGVLEAATVLSSCKVACSLLFLPSVTTSSSPISFCCCCLLLFTDLLVTAFLTFLYIAESWLPQLSLPSDVIALRFLLFLSHTYGTVVLFIAPLIALETVMGHLWPLADPVGTAGEVERVSISGPLSHVVEVAAEEEEDEGQASQTDGDEERGRRLSPAAGYLCCLSVWIICALHVSWRMEELWAVACLHTAKSLIVCLPNLLTSSGPKMVPGWSLSFLCLLLLLTAGASLHRRCQIPTQADRPKRSCQEKCGASNSGESSWQHPAPMCAAPSKTLVSGMPASEPRQAVDAEKTQNSCPIHTACSWNGMQMLPCHHGDIVFLSPQFLSAEVGLREHSRTKGDIPLAYITKEHTDAPNVSQCGWQQWGFPCQGVNLMTGLLCVLSVSVLPLNLSVNVLLIRTIEAMLEQCIKYFLSLQQRPFFHNSTQRQNLS